MIILQIVTEKDFLQYVIENQTIVEDHPHPLIKGKFTAFHFSFCGAIVGYTFVLHHFMYQY